MIGRLAGPPKITARRAVVLGSRSISAADIPTGAVGARSAARVSTVVQPDHRMAARGPRSPCDAVAHPHMPSIRMVRGWLMMVAKVHELRPKFPDTEKITINLGYVDLGRVDLLVREGFYS